MQEKEKGKTGGVEKEKRKHKVKLNKKGRQHNDLNQTHDLLHD